MDAIMKSKMAHKLLNLLNEYEREALEHEDPEHGAKLDLDGRIKDFLIYACCVEGVQA